MAKTLPQENTKEVHASVTNLRITPRKMRLLTGLVKGMRVSDALVQLQFANKKAAPMLTKLLRSAVANAENNFKLKGEDLVISSLKCNMGRTMRKYFPRARGSAFVVRKRLASVDVVLVSAPKKDHKKSRFTLPKFAKKTEEKVSTPESEAKLESTKPEGSKPQIGKTEQQVKQNRVAQKRRLFNRKSGE